MAGCPTVTADDRLKRRSIHQASRFGRWLAVAALIGRLTEAAASSAPGAPVCGPAQQRSAQHPSRTPPRRLTLT